MNAEQARAIATGKQLEKHFRQLNEILVEIERYAEDERFELDYYMDDLIPSVMQELEDRKFKLTRKHGGRNETYLVISW